MLDHIDAHLDEPLSLGALSRVAGFSQFHVHRQFSAYVGVPPARYVQLMRLRRGHIDRIGLTVEPAAIAAAVAPLA